MPLVRIDMQAGKPQAYREQVGQIVYEAMTSVLNVPKDDQFQVIAEHQQANFVVNPRYLGIERSRDTIFIQITLNTGRSTELKKLFYASLAAALHDRAGLRLEDVFISLVEVPKENWSFGNGVAQYA